MSSGSTTPASSSYPSFSETLASVQSADEQTQAPTPPAAAAAPVTLHSAPVSQAAPAKPTPVAAPAASAKPVNAPAHSATSARAKADKGSEDARPVKGATTATDASTTESLPDGSVAAKKSTNGSDQDGSASDGETTTTLKAGPAKPVTVAVGNEPVKEDVYLSDSSKDVTTTGDSQHPAPPDKTSATPAMSVVSTPKSKPAKALATAADAVLPVGVHGINPNAAVSNGASVAVPVAAPAAAPASASPVVATEAVPVTPDNALSLNASTTGKGKNQNADLAFAVKVQGKGVSASGAAAKAQPAQSNVGSDETTDLFAAKLDSLVTAAGEKENGKHGSGDGASERDAAAGSTALPVLDSTAVAMPAKSTPEVASSAASVVTEAPENTAAAPSLKTVQVQVTGADNQRIDLRMLERDGNLTISVRTSDGSLTKALQQQLPELGKQLDEQQVRAEWWTPEPQKITAAQKSNEASNDGGSNSNSGASDQRGDGGGNRGQQGGRGTQQPDWVEELASPRKSNQNGKQFAWHL